MRLRVVLTWCAFLWARGALEVVLMKRLVYMTRRNLTNKFDKFGLVLF